MNYTEIKKNIKSTFKSEDTEEPIDIYFYRPLGYFWAVLARRIHVTPNMITIASIFIGIGAGVLFYFPNLRLNIIGMVLLILANSFDSADGQLARMTNNKTPLGRILDGLAGNLWFIAIYISLVLRCIHSGIGYEIWIWASLAGASHIFQAAMADYYRNVHLYFLNGKSGSEFHNSKHVIEEYESLSWSKNFIEKLMLFFYRNYTKEQEFFTRSFQRLMQKLNEKYPDRQYPQELRNDFRTYSKPLMKYTNILQFNTRVIFLFICLFANRPQYYFFFDLVILTGVLIYMIYKHEKLSKKMRVWLEEGKYR